MREYLISQLELTRSYHALGFEGLTLDIKASTGSVKVVITTTTINDEAMAEIKIFDYVGELLFWRADLIDSAFAAAISYIKTWRE